MIELQGSVTGASFDGQLLGSLRFNEKGEPELAIGTRVLEGKAEKLKQPLLAVKRSEESELGILGVVRQRLLFNSRPRIETTVSVRS